MRKFNLKVLLLLSLGHLITDIYQGALPAILPFLKAKLGLTYTTAGIILVASNLTSSVIQPLFGFLSDKKEKALFLPLGCLCAGIGFSLLSMPSHYVGILILVLVSGLGIASYHPEGYKTAYYFTGDRMVTGMSIFSVGGNLGVALGPIISLYIITHLGFSFLPLMLVFSILFTALVLYSWKALTIPKIGPVENKKDHSATAKGAYVSLFMITATVITRSWTQIGIVTYIPFYYIDYLKENPLYAGKLISVFLLGGVLGTLAGSPLADRWGHKLYLTLSLLLTSLILPLILVVKGGMLFLVLGLAGMILISSFTVTIVMAQQLLPQNLGIASGLMVGFAIGTGGIGVTILGVVADHFGVPFALRTIMVLPIAGLILSMALRYPSSSPQP